MTTPLGLSYASLMLENGRSWIGGLIGIYWLYEAAQAWTAYWESGETAPPWVSLLTGGAGVYFIYRLLASQTDIQVGRPRGKEVDPRQLSARERSQSQAQESEEFKKDPELEAVYQLADQEKYAEAIHLYTQKTGMSAAMAKRHLNSYLRSQKNEA